MKQRGNNLFIKIHLAAKSRSDNPFSLGVFVSFATLAILQQNLDLTTLFTLGVFVSFATLALHPCIAFYRPPAEEITIVNTQGLL